MTTLNQVYQNQLQKEVTINENFAATSIAGIFANKGNQNGLSYNYYGGRYQKQDGTQGTVADGSISLADNSTNYVFFNISTELVEINTTGVPNNCFPVAKVTTASGVITAIEDLRVVALYANGTPTNLSYTLPIATDTVLGGVKVGAGLTIDMDGILSTSGGGSGYQTTITRTTAIQSTTLATLTDITDMSVSLEANATYEVDAMVLYQSTATTLGITIGFISADSSVNNLEFLISVANNAVSTALRKSFPTAAEITSGTIASTSSSPANTDLTIAVKGYITTTLAGTFKLQFASELGGSAVSIRPNSILVLKKIG